jgi:hypothetical protein
MVFEIAICHSFDLGFRWMVSTLSPLCPSVSHDVDCILARWKLAPLNHFFPEHHPRLHAIIDAIRPHLQNPQNNIQILHAYNQILGDMHQNLPDEFPTVTILAIQDYFTDYWPLISPLEKAFCLDLNPTAICWGKVDHGNNRDKPMIWINPYLVQALEAVQQVCDAKH